MISLPRNARRAEKIVTLALFAYHHICPHRLLGSAVAPPPLLDKPGEALIASDHLHFLSNDLKVSHFHYGYKVSTCQWR